MADTRSLVVSSALAFAAALVAAVIGSAVVIGATALAHAKSDAGAVVQVLREFATRTIQVGDLVLDEAEETLRARGGLEGLPDDRAVHERLRRLAERLPDGGGALVVVSPEGLVLARDDVFPAPPGVDLSDREWVAGLRADPSRAQVGPAIASRLIDVPVFTYARAVLGPDGAPTAFVGIGVPVAALVGAADRAGAPAHLAVSILREDGRVVAAAPFSEAALERVETIPAAVAAPPGAWVGRLAADGPLVVASHDRLEPLDLVLLAAAPLSAALAPLGWTLAIGAPMLGLVLFGGFLLTRTATRSIDEAALATQDLRRALDDKRVLFDEVHHRVKNNLQIISSLLSQQARGAPPEVAEALAAAARRVRAIAIVHEQIYGAGAPSRVDMAAYLRTLCDGLRASLDPGDRVETVLDLEPAAARLKEAVPIAIVAAEALANAFKHAFGEEGGRIVVTLRREGEWSRLAVSDDGRGLPAEGRPGVGLTMIRALARQINGEHGLESAPGGGATLWLRWPDATARRGGGRALGDPPER